MQDFNPYAELGLDPDKPTTPAALKRAYRTRCKQTHPDAQGGSEEAFARVQLAYAILTNPARKAAYDATGAVEEKQDQSRPAGLGMINTELGKILNEYLESGFNPELDPRTINLVGKITKRLAQQRAETFASSQTGERAIEMLRDLAERFIRKHPEGECPIAAGLLLQASRNEANLEAVRNGIKALDAAIALLGDYEFRRTLQIAGVGSGAVYTTGGTFFTNTSWR